MTKWEVGKMGIDKVEVHEVEIDDVGRYLPEIPSAALIFGKDLVCKLKIDSVNSHLVNVDKMGIVEVEIDKWKLIRWE